MKRKALKTENHKMTGIEKIAKNLFFYGSLGFFILGIIFEFQDLYSSGLSFSVVKGRPQSVNISMEYLSGRSYLILSLFLFSFYLIFVFTDKSSRKR